MNRGRWITLIVVLLIAYVAIGPFFTMHQIKQGLKEHDTEKLSDNINFPLLRHGLKDQFSAELTKQFARKPNGNPFSGLTGLVADVMINAMVTPAGLAKIMVGKKPALLEKESASTDTEPQKEPFKNARYTVDSINRFSAWVQGENGKELRFVFSRSLLDWKLTNIVVPFK